MPEPADPNSISTFELRDVTSRLWRLGPTRSSNVYYPCDEVLFTYTIAGAAIDGQGNADLDLELTVLDESGHGLVADPQRIQGQLVLGGGTVPGEATAWMSTNVRPGGFTLSVKVRDRLSGREAEFQRPIVLRPEAFAIVSPRFSLDSEGRIPSPCGGLVGRTLHYDFKLVGFSRSQGRVDASMTMTVLDDLGRQTMPSPPGFAIRTDDARTVAAAEHLEFRGQLMLNRPGRFVIRFDVRDEISGETTSAAYPLIVEPA